MQFLSAATEIIVSLISPGTVVNNYRGEITTALDIFETLFNATTTEIRSNSLGHSHLFSAKYAVPHITTQV